MLRGRKPKPTALRILEGNRGKRPLNHDEPAPEVILPDPPADWVEKTKLPEADRRSIDAQQIEALAEWHRRGPRLVALGVLTELDVPAFRAYCDAWGRYVEANAQIEKNGEIVRAPSGYPIPNPYRSVANRALDQCQSFWSDFGMNPSSRTRIHVRPGTSAKPHSKVQKFMAAKPGRRLA